MANSNRIIVAGASVAEEIAVAKASMVKRSSKIPGCFDSASLCEFQRHLSNQGYIEAEIVESMYGFSVRYASGLQNFGLISAARDRADKSYDGAVAFATDWQSKEPSRRFVTFHPDD